MAVRDLVLLRRLEGSPGHRHRDAAKAGTVPAELRTIVMLVLTRKLMEKLYIGNEICVTVVRLEGGQVRLGIDAPREIAVVRAELLPDRRQLTEPETPVADGLSLTTRPGLARGTGIRRRGPSR